MAIASNAVVHIVDDEPQVCQALSCLLEAAGFDTRCHTSGEHFFDEFDPAVPGCIVADVCMPGMSGLAVQDQLRAANVTIPVVILTGHADVPMAVEAMAKGAMGFLQKPPRSHELLELIASAVARHAESLDQRKRQVSRDEKLRRLSERERDVLELVIEGRSSKDIASHCGISQRTVEQHRAHIMEKLGVTSLAQLVRVSIDSGGNS
jgi:two-component system response regulator FixJ